MPRRHGGGPQPLYSVFQARDHSVSCFRGVQNNPAQVGDFLTFADLDVKYAWWDAIRAMGVSAWVDDEKAKAIAYRKGLPWLAQVDLTQADGRTPWAFTGSSGHVTIWAPALVLLPAVVNYVTV